MNFRADEIFKQLFVAAYWVEVSCKLFKIQTLIGGWRRKNLQKEVFGKLPIPALFDKL